MNKKLQGIGAGIKAAAMSLLEDRPHYRVGTRRLVCPVCGHDQFDRHSVSLTSIAPAFVDVVRLGHDSCALVCRECTRMEFFAVAPTNE